MTNHWNDIDNASLVFAYGANPAENHPACMAHVNAARFGSKNAKLIVVDPRLTRTARQCDPARGDMFVRIRPGTNVAFTNGLLNWIFNNIHTYNAAAETKMLHWHNGDAGFNATNFTSDSTKTRTFVNDAGATITPIDTDWQAAYYGSATTDHPLATGYPKYCDTRFKVLADASDYQRDVLHVGSAGVAGSTITDFPVIAANVSDTSTVYQKLVAHVAAYDTLTVADICGCTEVDIANVAKALIDNSRFNSADFGVGTATPQVSTYKATTILYAMGQTQHTNGSQNIKDLAVIQTLMGNMGRPGGGINALRGIHNVQGSTDMGLLYDSIPAYGDNPGKSDVTETFGHYVNTQFGNRLYGNTAATAATLTFRGTAPFSGVTFTAKPSGEVGNSYTIQYLDPSAPLGVPSVGVVGTAITVNLETDGSGAIKSTAADIVDAVNGFPAAFALVKAALAASAGTGVVVAKPATAMTGGTAALADLSATPGKLGLQQRGFFNMTTEWFGTGTSTGADVVKLYDLWPKGDGVQHIQTFRYMASTTAAADLISAAVIWGQNPAITEPNQGAVRTGLRNLDLMVVVDMYETETAAVDRKSTAAGDLSDGITYLIPACSHAEGNSKADLELLLRFAYALDKAGAFSHMTNVRYAANGTVSPVGGVVTSGVWSILAAPINGPAYKVLYGDKYGWTPTDATTFEGTKATAGAIERWAPGATAPDTTTFVAEGSEVFAEAIYKEMCRPTNFTGTTGGTMWIYSGSDTGAADIGGGATPGVGGWNNGVSYNGNFMPTINAAGSTVDAAGNATTWQVKNRAKSRNNLVKGSDANGANDYPRWGWAWLLNRRVFYNNGEVAGDQSDTFVAPGLVALLYTTKDPADAGLADWSLVYRKYKTFKDVPSVVPAGAGQNTSSPHFLSAGLSFAGRFPGHTEPTESPRPDLVTTWGHNTSGGAALYWTGANPTAIGAFGAPADGKYPLVLTTIRCVEHFQGGPITRNNSWNVEAEPVPWIEINAADARTYGIADGDWVNVKTARGNSQKSQEDNSPNSQLPGGAHWARGFKARVGVGLESNQRVGRGVVAIPWHWGDKGLSTGSRANDLCIDAWDANTTIPEYKACLCKIETMS
jgi:anaerobic selenocysteine-containing dehydrogenase